MDFNKCKFVQKGSLSYLYEGEEMFYVLYRNKIVSKIYDNNKFLLHECTLEEIENTWNKICKFKKDNRILEY